MLHKKCLLLRVFGAVVVTELEFVPHFSGQCSGCLERFLQALTAPSRSEVNVCVCHCWDMLSVLLSDILQFYQTVIYAHEFTVG